MNYTERTYIQNANGCVRNKDILNVRTSSDWCEFTPPAYDISGATKIQPLSATSEGAYLLTGETSVDITYSFSGDLSTHLDTYTYAEIYKYDLAISAFTQPSIYLSDGQAFSAITGTSGYTLSLPISTIQPDNEYLIKSFVAFDACTELLNALDVRYDNRSVLGDSYGIYNETFDYYMSVSEVAQVPFLSESSGYTSTSYGNLVSYSRFPETDGKTEFVIANHLGEVMVNLNGITLAKGFDYSISGNVVSLSGQTYTTDILTFVHTTGTEGNEGLINDFIDVNVISSGATNGQGSNSVYYNTTQSKYEIYTTVNIAPNSDVIVTLNGVTLANNVDYFRSITNEKRIILNGDIYSTDVINIFYYGNITYVGSIYTSTPVINWSVAKAPSLVNGKFTIELANDTSFSVLSFSSVTDYVVGQTFYSDTLSVSGDVGTNYFYRIKNDKFYQPITGDTLDTVAYSEAIPITIQSNAVNSY